MNEPTRTRRHFLLSGKHACFRRLEFERALVSYDVIPPGVARMILAKAYPNDTWHLLKLTVLRAIEHEWVESESGKSTLSLVEPSYLLTAESEAATGTSTQSAATYLGLPEMEGTIRCLGFDDPLPPSEYRGRGAIDLGWMRYDLNGTPRRARFFRSKLVDGEIDLSAIREQDLLY